MQASAARLGRLRDRGPGSAEGEGRHQIWALRKLKVFGYASTIFGATAALGRVRGFSADTLANALAIAAYITPVNPQMSFFAHPPTPTIKYLAAGVMAQQALTAAFLGEFGHHGDLTVLDDAELGYRRYIGT